MTNEEYLREDQEAEEGARYGDPRRCPRHGCPTSSGDGMHDCPCPMCEFEADHDAEDDGAVVLSEDMVGFIEKFPGDDELGDETPDDPLPW